MLIYHKIAKKMPDLPLKLRQARLPDSDVYYIRKTWFTAMYTTFIIMLILLMLFKKLTVLLLFPVIFLLAFNYFLKYVDLKIFQLQRDIDKEIIFAGRFLIIELQSGVPLYQAFKNLAKNYEVIGKFFQEIVEKVELGTPLEDAVNEAIILTPSPNLRKMLWQVLNSMKTGSDVTSSLNVVIDQIVREQQISVREYSKKLNPLAMFYMIMAIILPSLGTTFLTVLATFIGLHLTLSWLLVITLLLAFVQFMFLSMIRSSRPPIAF